MDYPKCIECGKRIFTIDESKDYWFCGETCAAYCCMWSYREGMRTPDEALKKLTLRHKKHKIAEDLVRIEKILEKLHAIEGEG